MPIFRPLPIMPKESKPHTTIYASASAPYPNPTSNTAGPRTAAIWSAGDDEILLQARASGLNWQPIATRHFPNKTANACRKRHERLIERRYAEDWDAQKLEFLAQEYLAVRKEMWEMLASRVGERWALVEAKCMEKGLRTLQSTARTAQRRADTSGRNTVFEDQGTADHHSDSGIGLGSDAEMEVDGTGASKKSASHAGRLQPGQDHMRSRSLPQPLPLYRPPPPPPSLNTSLRQTVDADAQMSTSPATMSYVRHTSSHRHSPESQNGRGGISIQAVLSPANPQYG